MPDEIDPAAIVASRSAAAFCHAHTRVGAVQGLRDGVRPGQPRSRAASAARAHGRRAHATRAHLPEPRRPPPAPTVPEPTVPAPTASILDEASFAARLEEATTVPEPSPAFIAFDELGGPAPAAAEPEREPSAEITPDAGPQARSGADPRRWVRRHAHAAVRRGADAVARRRARTAARRRADAAAPSPAPTPPAAAAPRAAAPRAGAPAFERWAARGKASSRRWPSGCMQAALAANTARSERRAEERRARAAAEAEARREQEARARARELSAAKRSSSSAGSSTWASAPRPPGV